MLMFEHAALNPTQNVLSHVYHILYFQHHMYLLDYVNTSCFNYEPAFSASSDFPPSLRGHLKLISGSVVVGAQSAQRRAAHVWPRARVAHRTFKISNNDMICQQAHNILE